MNTSTVSLLAASVAELEEASFLQSQQMFFPAPYGLHTFSSVDTAVGEEVQRQNIVKGLIKG